MNISSGFNFYLQNVFHNIPERPMASGNEDALLRGTFAHFVYQCVFRVAFKKSLSWFDQPIQVFQNAVKFEITITPNSNLPFCSPCFSYYNLKLPPTEQRPPVDNGHKCRFRIVSTKTSCPINNTS